MEQRLDGELTAHLGYEKDAAEGRNSGNSQHGQYKRHLKSSAGEVSIAAPRDRAGEFQPQIRHQYETSSNEVEDKIVAL